MKNIILLGSFLAFLLMFSSCEDNDWPEPDIEKVPVYSITGISGSGAPHALEVYRNEDTPLMIEFKNANLLANYKTSDYVDASTESTFNITYSIQRPAVTAAGEDTVITNLYELVGSKEDVGLDTLNIGVVSSVDTTYSEFIMTIKLEERYN